MKTYNTLIIKKIIRFLKINYKLKNNFDLLSDLF